MARRPRKLAPTFLSAVLAACLMTAALSGSILPARADSQSDIRVLGVLPAFPANAVGSQVVGVEPGTRRLLAWYSETAAAAQSTTPHFYFREYGIGSDIPTVIRDKDMGAPFALGGQAPYRLTFDTKRDRVLFIGIDPTQSQTDSITSIDLKTLTIKNTWYLNPQTVPGFSGDGITYSPEDDLIYIVGEWNGTTQNHPEYSPVFAEEGGLPATVSGVVALHASDGSLAWVRPVLQCQLPLATEYIGAALARAQDQDALYFGCMRPRFSPGVSGIVRLWLHAPGSTTPPAVASTQDALKFPVEFFPISGSYYPCASPLCTSAALGIIGFDYRTDRVFMQSMATSTPGAWVFDGHTSSWVGQIATPAPAMSLGINQGSGHVYMANPSGSVQPFMIVSDGRQTPAPEGAQFGFGAELPFIATDPESNRLFVEVPDVHKFVPSTSPGEGFLVLEDDTPSSTPQAPIDYDQLTTNVPEGPSTTETYSGTVGGFGVRASLVGGYGGLLSIPNNYVPQSLNPTHNGIAGVSPGDRSFTVAEVPIVDVRNIGTTASAQAIAPDSTTDDERHTYQNSAGTPPSQTVSDTKNDSITQAASNLDAPTERAREDLAATLAWPWGATSCLDASGTATTMKASGPAAEGQASSSCDLANSRASAYAERADRFGVTPQNFSFAFDPNKTLNISVGSSSFASTVHRDPTDGITTDTTATAQGIAIGIKGQGSLSIKRILAHAITRAHGHLGTAFESWTPTIEGFLLRDANGKIVGSCELCSPQQVADQTNQMFETHLRLYANTPDQEHTPMGAYAGIQKQNRAYYNDLTVNNDDSRAVPVLTAVLINDTVEKSRLVVQFAAIQAASIYGVSLNGSSFGGCVCPPPVPVPPGGGGLLGSGGGQGGSSPSGDQGGHDTGGVFSQVLHHALLLARSPGQGVLAGLIWVLFAGLGGAIARRKRLMGLLEEAS